MTWLQQLRERRERGEQGFTLIELLLVIVILGVLSAVVVLSVRGISDRGEESACAATQTAVITANEAYYAQTGNAPVDTDDLVGSFLTLGSGASVVGNTVSGQGWSFEFNPATGTVTTANGCDITGGGPGGPGDPGGGDPGGGDPADDCVVSAVTGNSVQLQTGGTLPAFAINATTENCDGVTLEVFIQGGITAALGATVPAGTTGYTTGDYDGVIRIQGGANVLNFTFTVTEAPAPAVCEATGLSPLTYQLSAGSDDLPSNFSWTVTLNDACNGIPLEIFISRPGAQVVRENFNGNGTTRTTSSLEGDERDDWNATSYTAVVRDQSAPNTVRGTFTFTVTAAPVCTINSVSPTNINVSGNPGDIPTNTVFTVTVSAGCNGIPLEVFINRSNGPGRADIELNVGPNNATTRTGTLTSPDQRNDWSNGFYDIVVRHQTTGTVYRTFNDGFRIQ